MTSERNSGSSLHPILSAVSLIIPDLAKSLGPYAEVVLHDISQPQNSIVAIGGTITGRQVGGPATDLLLRLLRDGGPSQNLVNYSTHTADGRTLRSTTLFLRDENGEAVGCLCVNIEVTPLLYLRDWIENLCGFPHAQRVGMEEEAEFFPGSVDEILQQTFQGIVQSVGKPVAHMTKSDRERILQMLDQKGIFLIKKSADYVAERLGVSRATLYSDLSNVRDTIDADTEYGSEPSQQ